jgi:hypothetical protein
MFISQNKICVVRTTFYDRSAFLLLSTEYQERIEYACDLYTYIFIDPHPKYGISSHYSNICNNGLYKKIILKNNRGKLSWYKAIYDIFQKYEYDYIISIEDDIVLSTDYFRLCYQLVLDGALDKDDNILMFHCGAWGEPKGNDNTIVRSSASLRSCMISRNKFNKFIIPYYNNIKTENIEGLDIDIKNILNSNKLTTICPEKNRHGHFGVYGWSSNGCHADDRGKASIFNEKISHNEIYDMIKPIALSGEKLINVNKNHNPDYFWNFDPNINFTKLIYKL